MNQKSGSNPAGVSGLSFSAGHVLASAHQALGAGELAQAESLCRQVLREDPANGEALHLLALVAHRVGKLDDAIALVQQAVAATPNNAAWQSNLCEMLRQAGRLEEAEAAGQKALKLDPESSSVLNNLGIVLQERGKLVQAERMLRKALDKEPGSGRLQNNLGNTLKKLDRLEEAVAAFRKANQLDPQYAEAWSNLSVALHQLDRYEEALQAALTAIRLRPDYAEAHNNASLILKELDRLEEAVAAAQQAIRIRPDYPEGHAALALALDERGQLNGALQAVEKALSFARNAEVLATWGQILHKVGRLDEAEAAYREALEADPGRAETLNGLGLVLVEQGSQEDATDAFLRAIQLQPSRRASYLFNYASAVRFRDAATELSPFFTCLEELERGGGTTMDLAHVHYALGKAHQDLKDHETAWKHYAEGARHKRSTLPENPFQRNLQAFASLPGLFTPELYERLAGQGDPSSQPIFIVGMPRSGTSLVEQILASHGEVYGAGELPDMNLVVSNVRDASGNRITYPEFLPQLTPEALAEMGRRYVAHVAGRIPETPRFTDKMPGNFAYVGLIRLMLPNARIIHCRRNPIDTCVSCFTNLFSAHQDFSYDLTELGQYYRAYQAVMEHWDRVLPAGSLLEVQYEDVVADLEGQVRRLLEYCGLPWDERCLSFHETRRAVRTASMTQVRQPLYNTSVERWRRYEAFLEPLRKELGV
ncbi:MAG TPA: sulfotransferase [Gammaproteobacteria bacterium]|nr:sulfotransferase [Gammaproteobacteria bacterium]